MKNEKQTEAQNVGLAVQTTQRICNDKKCPFHGNVNTKREEFVGVIVKKDANRSATLEFERRYYVHKYERYEKRLSRLRVHNPECIDAAIGDIVHVFKTRPLSKTKNFVIVEIVAKKVSR